MKILYVYNISSNKFCRLRFSLGRTRLWIDYITDESDGLYSAFGQARRWRCALKNRRKEVSRLSRMTVNSLSQGRTLPPYDWVFLPCLRSLSFFTRSQVQLFRPLERAPEYLCHGEAGRGLGRTPRAFALVFFSTRVLEIFVPRITAKADRATS